MRARIPNATYRLQLTAELDLDAAAELVPYLAELGISDLYASPILTTRPGSSHGYDVADPTRLNPQLGGDAGFAHLSTVLADHQLGLILDIVPNHMAADPANPWWADVLRHGPASSYASFFDLDWDPPSSPVTGRILLPVLGQPYHRALAACELVPELGGSGLAIRYYERSFPLDPATWPLVFRPVATNLGSDHDAGRVLDDLVNDLEDLPPRRPDAEARAARRHWDREGWPRLERLLHESPAVASALDDELRRLAGRRGRAASFDRLHVLLSRQAFRLAHWRSAREKLNYRRFFNISDLVGLRTERQEVFSAVHEKVLELVAGGGVTGLRVDHVDGLRDPLAYLHRLHDEATAARRDPYLVVEKILGAEEELTPDWPVHGTTGYDFLAAANAMLVDPVGLNALERTTARLTHRVERFAERAFQARRRIVRDLFPGELRALEHRLADLAEGDRWACDIPRRALRKALEEVTACLPVYRTYSRGEPVGDRDRRLVEQAVTEARRRVPTLAAQALGFLRRLLCLELPADLDDEERFAWQDFVLRWQQVTGPVAAKGVEDTAFYQEARLISLAEVGGDPETGALSPAGFHHFVAARTARWPHSMSATATHDTKRGEDARARLAVLSELGDAWSDHVDRWWQWNRPHRVTLESGPVPDTAAELILYQTLVATWPAGEANLGVLRERVAGFMIKAAREAKERSSWLRPDEAYESALRAFIDAALSDPGSPFVTDLAGFADEVAFFGFLNSLTQVTLKLTAPGVPDFYQGTELWDLSLVDPDNRRTVDFARRRALLTELRRRHDRGPTVLAAQLLDGWRDGRVKLWLMHRLLDLRRRLPDLFRDGDYQPVPAAGPAAPHVVSFARRLDSRWLLVAVPRLLTRITPPGHPPLGESAWAGTTLCLPAEAPGHWTNALTGIACTSPELATLFEDFPVAVMTGSRPG